MTTTAVLAVLVLVWAVPYARHLSGPGRVALSAALAVLLGASAAAPSPRPDKGMPPPLVAPFALP